MAQDRHRRRAQYVVFRRKRAAPHRRHTQNIEQVRRDYAARDHHLIVTQVQSLPSGRVRHYRVQCGEPISAQYIGIRLVRNRTRRTTVRGACLRTDFTQNHQPIRSRKWQRPKPHRVNHRERC
jgi:hypothetical protein